MNSWDAFPGPKAGYVRELYDRDRQNPDSVDAGTRAYFENWPKLAEPAAHGAPEFALNMISGAVNLAHCIRGCDHPAATLDPHRGHLRGDPSLVLGTYGLLEDDLRARVQLRAHS